MVFYFFKVTLSFFDDEKTEFFITPNQSETDDEGIPFSEYDMQNTPEFKEFVKRTKADVIDVDYTEFAAEIDPKKSEEILNNPVTPETFAKLESERRLNVVDENQLILVLKGKKKAKGKSNGGMFAVIGIALILLIALGALSQAGKHTDGTTTSPDSIFETSEDSEGESSGNSSEESEESSSESDSESSTESTESDDISDNSEIVESDDGESFDFPPPEDISHLQEASDVQ